MTEDIFKKLCKDVECCVNNTDDITELLQIWEVFNSGLKEATEINDKLKTKIKNYLKERKWDHYKDKKSKISVDITTIKRENIDKRQLRLLLTNAEYSQVINTIEYERLQILTQKNKKELRKIVGKKT